MDTNHLNSMNIATHFLLSGTVTSHRHIFYPVFRQSQPCTSKLKARMYIKTVLKLHSLSYLFYKNKIQISTFTVLTMCTAGGERNQYSTQDYDDGLVLNKHSDYM